MLPLGTAEWEPVPLPLPIPLAAKRAFKRAACKIGSSAADEESTTLIAGFNGDTLSSSALKSHLRLRSVVAGGRSVVVVVMIEIVKNKIEKGQPNLCR